MKNYFKYKLKTIVLYVIWVLIFAVIFSLYHLPIKAVLYPTAICAVVGIFALIIDGGRTVERHRLMTKLNSQAVQLKEDLAENCPKAESIPEEDYREMVALLCDAAAKAENDAFRKYSDMMDYYTVWVHQIKTPIAAMRLNLQAQDSSEARALLSDLNRIESYVTMVLTYLRLDSESNDYIIKEYDLDEIIIPTVKKFAGEFIGKKLSLNFHGTGAKVLTDEKWLAFVLEQVISNAVKYTSTGSISIYVEGMDPLLDFTDDSTDDSTDDEEDEVGSEGETESVGNIGAEDENVVEAGNEAKAGDGIKSEVGSEIETESVGDIGAKSEIEFESEKARLVLCIQDTGMGISAEDLPRIFENGYTGFNGRVDKRASGIGLYLCRRICTSLGHEITAESVVGQGTTMKIKF